MDMTIEQSNIVETYCKAYELCLNCKFQESYNLVKDIAKNYDIPFYAVLCLNIENYGYYKHLDKTNLIPIENNFIELIDNDFKEICNKAKLACEVAYNFNYDMVLRGIFCEKDQNATVNLTELQRNINTANHFASEAISDTNELSSRAAWRLSRKYIIKALMIFSDDPNIWKSLAKTYLHEPVYEGYIEGYVAIMRAKELEDDFLTENFESVNKCDFDLHYTLLKYMVLLKQYGLEQPLEIARELKILEMCKKTVGDTLKLEELKNDIKNAELHSIFCYKRNSNPPTITTQKIFSEHESLESNYDKEQNSGCYIATAVYGSYDCPEVWTLRRYRDYILSETWYGRTFIKIYYSTSPMLVKWFGNTKWFKAIWKFKLDKLVAYLQINGIKSSPYQDKKR